MLDPCCGTGAYVAAVLRRIDRTLADKGLGGLRGQMVKKAALERVLGFEIMPAPFIVAHLQVGSVLQQLEASLTEDHERASVYLTNALTGWEPTTSKPLPFPGLEEERKKAEKLKQEAPILVILGNPPYNGYAGVTIGEERDLSEAYRKYKHVRKPEGHGLNDLYVRFFRMAERRIVDKTGRGIVSFITNFEWLGGLSHTGMRERFLEVFDAIRIDCLNGDSRETGKTTPDGKPDPSIFSTEHNREGIRKGTAIATLVRKSKHKPRTTIAFRNLWGVDKRQLLLDTAEADPDAIYSSITPVLKLGLQFKATTVSVGYLAWPKLPELLPVSFPGVKTSRDDFLVSIDRDVLETRLRDYFDPKISDEEIRAKYPLVMAPSGGFDPKSTRDALRKRGRLPDNIMRYTYRPFDIRWMYWEAETKLLDRNRAEYLAARVPQSIEMVIPRAQRKEWSPPLVTRSVLDLNAMDGGAAAIPFRTTAVTNVPGSVANSTDGAQSDRQGAIFGHCLAILHSPSYFTENGGAMRVERPRIPLPGDTKLLRASTALGATLATLLDPETPAPGVSTGTLRAGLKTLGLPTKRGGKGLDTGDLKLTAGWGSTQNAAGGGRIVMPGRGLANERAYSDAERAALAAEGKAIGLSLDEVLALFGDKTFDIHLNTDAWWSNVPARVWDYTLGGYQVIKKWLSYREHDVLGRPLKPDEAAYVSEMVRRIAAILLLGPDLDNNYAESKAAAVEWKDGVPVQS